MAAGIVSPLPICASACNGLAVLGNNNSLQILALDLFCRKTDHKAKSRVTVLQNALRIDQRNAQRRFFKEPLETVFGYCERLTHFAFGCRSCITPRVRTRPRLQKTTVWLIEKKGASSNALHQNFCNLPCTAFIGNIVRRRILRRIFHEGMNATRAKQRFDIPPQPAGKCRIHEDKAPGFIRRENPTGALSVKSISFFALFANGAVNLSFWRVTSSMRQ